MTRLRRLARMAGSTHGGFSLNREGTHTAYERRFSGQIRSTGRFLSTVVR